MSESVVTPGAVPSVPAAPAVLPEIQVEAPSVVLPAPVVPEPPAVLRSGSGDAVLTEFQYVARGGVRGFRGAPAAPGQRLAVATAPERAVAGDALMLASGHLGLVAALARLGAMVALDLVLVGLYEEQARPAIWATVPMLLWSVLLITPGRRLDPTRPLTRWVDLGIALGATFLVQAYAPHDSLVLPAMLGFVMLACSVGAWTSAAGAVGAAVPILFDVPVQVAAVIAAHHWRDAPIGRAATVSAAQVLGLLLTVVLTCLAIAAVAIALHRAATVAFDAGATAAQVGMHRNLHDTVLPTLEAIALPVAVAGDPGSELRRLRTAARAQATRIRHVIDMRPRSRPAVASLREQIGLLGTEFGAEGLAVEIVLPDVDGDSLSTRQRIALCDAAREALRNVVKHAEVGSAVLMLEVQPSVVRIVVRDHGAGMTADTHAGFGITQSINARLAEVGGSCELWSKPGRGTRVTLTVPADDSLPA